MHSKSKLALWISLQFIVKSHHYALRLYASENLGLVALGEQNTRIEGSVQTPFLHPYF